MLDLTGLQKCKNRSKAPLSFPASVGIEVAGALVDVLGWDWGKGTCFSKDGK